jgi:hypothetical protein
LKMKVEKMNKKYGHTMYPIQYTMEVYCFVIEE